MLLQGWVRLEAPGYGVNPEGSLTYCTPGVAHPLGFLYTLQGMGTDAARRVAGRYYQKLADYIGDMSRDLALKILGLTGHPSTDEIEKAHKVKALENHPDRGGSHEKMVEVNVAKDYLLGRGKRQDWRPEPPPEPARPKYEPPKVVDKVTGNPFTHMAGEVPHAEWLFISKPEWVQYPREYPGFSAYVWVAFGKTANGFVVAGLKNRPKNSAFDHTKGGIVEIEDDWEAAVTHISNKFDIVKAGPKAVKMVCSMFKDQGKVGRVPQKYVMWPGGPLEEAAVKSVKYGSGGANFKDILLSAGLVNMEHREMVDRKANVEITPKANLDKIKALRKERYADHKPVYAWEGFDYFVSVNGKAGVQLTDETMKKLEKNGFIMLVFKWDPNNGVPKNLGKIRGGRWGFKGGEVIKLLADSLTTEPSSLVEELKKAAESWKLEPETPEVPTP